MAGTCGVWFPFPRVAVYLCIKPGWEAGGGEPRRARGAYAARAARGTRGSLSFLASPPPSADRREPIRGLRRRRPPRTPRPRSAQPPAFTHLHFPPPPVGAGLASHPREADLVGSEGALRGGIKRKKRRKNNKSEVTRTRRRVSNVHLEKGAGQRGKEDGEGKRSRGRERRRGPGRREAGEAAGRAGRSGRRHMQAALLIGPCAELLTRSLKC